MSALPTTNDSRELPAYTVLEAAHYFAVPATTVRYWSIGRDQHKPLIQVPQREPTLLSFLNLTELHVLAAIRSKHGVKMPSLRTAIQYLSAHADGEMNKRHLLISHEFERNGLDPFIEQYGRLINASHVVQISMRKKSARRCAG